MRLGGGFAPPRLDRKLATAPDPVSSNIRAALNHMASVEDHRNAKVRALIMKQHDYVPRHQTNMDQLKQRRNIKISQIARQAAYEAGQFRSAAAARPGGLESKYIQRLEVLEEWLKKQPPRFNNTPVSMP